MKMPRTRARQDGQLSSCGGTTRKTTPMKKQSRHKTTPMKKERKKITRQLSRAEVAIVADVDDTKLLCDVFTTVPKDLVGELFPERVQLWENLVTCPDKLEMFVSYVTDRYIQMYISCTGHDKNADLFLKWLDFTREFTCNSKQTDESATIIEEAFGNCHVNEGTMRTVLAILLNAVYLGLSKQMAIAVEKISTSTQQTTEST